MCPNRYPPADFDIAQSAGRQCLEPSAQRLCNRVQLDHIWFGGRRTSPPGACATGNGRIYCALRLAAACLSSGSPGMGAVVASCLGVSGSQGSLMTTGNFRSLVGRGSPLKGGAPVYGSSKKAPFPPRGRSPNRPRSSKGRRSNAAAFPFSTHPGAVSR